MDDVLFSCANRGGEDSRNVAQASLLLAGLRENVTGTTINRLCGCGMDAVAKVFRSIRAGEAEQMIDGGVESMCPTSFVLTKAEQPFARQPKIHDTTISRRFVTPRCANGAASIRCRMRTRTSRRSSASAARIRTASPNKAAETQRNG